jgi:hypothetical protein
MSNYTTTLILQTAQMIAASGEMDAVTAISEVGGARRGVWAALRRYHLAACACPSDDALVALARAMGEVQ